MALCWFVYSPRFLDIHCASYFCFSSLLTPVISKGKYHSGKDASVLSMIKEEEYIKRYSEELKTLKKQACHSLTFSGIFFSMEDAWITEDNSPLENKTHLFISDFSCKQSFKTQDQSRDVKPH